MKTTKMYLAAMFGLILSLAVGVYAQEKGAYAHITLVDNEAFIIGRDSDHAVEAVVNYPLVAGDIIFTREKGRCEVQFDNGTIMRLDSDTEVQLTHVLSESLTSRKKITTLHLNYGRLYSMSQSYKREIFIYLFVP